MDAATTTVKEAIDLLAELRVSRLETPSSYREKQAAEGSGWLGALGEAVKDPVISRALIGTGVGGLAGAGAYALGGDTDRAGKRRGLLSKVLTGALAGGAAGAGVGAVSKYTASPSAEPGTPASKLPPGHFYGPGGEVRKIDPEALKNNPELAKQVAQATAMPRPDRAAVLGTLGSIWDFAGENMPITRNAILPIGAADALAHTRLPPAAAGLMAKMVPPIGPLRRWAQSAAEHVPGLYPVEQNRSPDILRRGAIAAPEGHAMFAGKREALEALVKDPQKLKEFAAGRLPEFAHTHVVQPEVAAAGRIRDMREHYRDALEAYRGKRTDPMADPNDVRVARRAALEERNAYQAARREGMPQNILQTLGQNERQELNRLGAVADAANIQGHLPKDVKLPETNYIRRGVSGDSVRRPFLKSRPGMGRGLLYLGTPVAEYLGRAWLEERRKEQDLSSLQNRFSREVTHR